MPRVKKKSLRKSARRIVEARASEPEPQGGDIDETLASVANEEALVGDVEPESHADGGHGDFGDLGDFGDVAGDPDPDNWGDAGNMYGGFEDSMWAGETQMSRQNRVVQLLSDLQEVEARGYPMPKRFNHTSDPDEMEFVLETARNQLARQSGVKISRKLLTGFVGAVEFLNHRFDPIGLKLDSLSDNVSENIHDYDDVLGRIWMLYGPGSDGEMNPLLELAMMLIIAGGGVHMTNVFVERAREQQKQHEKKQQKQREKNQDSRGGNGRRHEQAFENNPDPAFGGLGGFNGVLPDFSAMQQEAPPMQVFPDLPADPVPPVAPAGLRSKANDGLDEALDEALAAAGSEPKVIQHSSSSSAKRGGKRGTGKKKKSHTVRLAQ